MGVRKKRTPPPHVPNGVDPAIGAQVDAILQDISQEVEHRVQSLLSLADTAASAIQNHFKVQLVKLPKKVRAMPLEQFKQEFGGDIAAAVLQDLDKRLAASKAGGPGPPATALRGLRQRGLASETPAVACTTRKRKAAVEAHERETQHQKTAALASDDGQDGAVAPPTEDVSEPLQERMPKLGETAYSARGSPLGKFEHNPGTKHAVLNTVLRGGTSLRTPMPGAFNSVAGAVATVIRRDKPGSNTGVADAIVVTTKDGSQIAVDLEGGLAAVPAKQRKEVQSQLEALRRLAESALGVTVRKK